MSTTQLYLASNSPRRLQLLQQLGLQVEVFSAETDETPFSGECPSAYVLRMAQQKNSAALALWQKQRQKPPHLPFLSADTIVVAEGRILGKPRNEAHAVQMLASLSARSHQVITAVCLFHQGQRHCLTQISRVCFKALTEDEIRRYVASKEPLDKAGAYGIQGMGGVFVHHIEGSFTGIMGLPVFETAQLLCHAGILLP
ncbi:Maf family protein [Necropsobacter massiliensis]|uniref:Maf family protein n=1 Tax=Necropsobacter massiliensis TaxID=1400001 RepID=UPI00059617E5|nr:nucleoside triphosphate pyrophosphatase [Necropsobacter massiliensis]